MAGFSFQGEREREQSGRNKKENIGIGGEIRMGCMR